MTTTDGAVIVWFRNDLRLTDNAALFHAAATGAPLIPLYIYSPEEEGDWAPGAASRWWLHHSLESLLNSLTKIGSSLLIRSGPVAQTLIDIAAESRAKTVYWNQRFEPAARRQEKQVTQALLKSGIDAVAHNSSLLTDPAKVETREHRPYKVFTPFWKTIQQLNFEQPLPAPSKLRTPERPPKSLNLASLELLPEIKWDAGIEKAWTVGEKGAHAQLRKFLREGVSLYPQGRDRPDKQLVSRMSPYLHFGEISPRIIWSEVSQTGAITDGATAGAESYLRELAWREFAYHLLYHFPETTDKPMRAEFAKSPWRADKEGLAAWQRGMTGYPIVDAGMRELWHTGWMHNRVRMIVASFLVKDLLISWREGARWFWDTLVDADLANNTLGWQWTAGCGADAAPYFRVFNPVLQGQKFDPAGGYVRKWVPELAKLPDKWLHQPWAAPEQVVAQAGIILGKSYPQPIVDHARARERALDALASIKRVSDAV
ncbi:MAG TPA: deoxyribodipyrimidine photo-lyase [Trichormus sp.]|jgi:deoxyribodipyrimidine photo-lyase